MEQDLRTGIIAGLAFLTGVLIGVGTGILLAPQAGLETRRRIADSVDDTANQMEKWVESAKDTAQGLSEEGKKLAARLTDSK